MTETKRHTLGPWTWQEDSDDRADMPRLVSPSGEVCHFGNCETYYPTEGTPPNEEDMRLIAAAPEMLSALEDALEFLQDWEDLSGGPAARKVRAAIEKATGSAP